MLGSPVCKSSDAWDWVNDRSLAKTDTINILQCIVCSPRDCNNSFFGAIVIYSLMPTSYISMEHFPYTTKHGSHFSFQFQNPRYTLVLFRLFSINQFFFLENKIFWWINAFSVHNYYKVSLVVISQLVGQNINTKTNLGSLCPQNNEKYFCENSLFELEFYLLYVNTRMQFVV